MEEKFIEYAPIILIVCIFLFRSKLVVTPTELSNMKEEILATVKEEYATKELVQFIREEIAEMLYEISKFFNVSIEYLFETHEYEGISNETLLEIKKRQRNFIILLSTFATIIILSIVAIAITAINSTSNYFFCIVCTWSRCFFLRRTFLYSWI